MVNKYAFYTSDIGIIKIYYKDDKILGISLVEKIEAKNETSKLTDKIFSEIEDYLKSKLKNFDFLDSLLIGGTDFQNAIWKELIKIPYGELRTYKEIAEAIANPKAYRAVGNAINKNPFFIVIPCHRVIGANGKLTGFAYGLDIKKKLLNIENNNKFL